MTCPAPHRAAALAALVLTLAACGIDGAPQRPAPKDPAPEPGLTVSATAEIGIAGGDR